MTHYVTCTWYAQCCIEQICDIWKRIWILSYTRKYSVFELMVISCKKSVT